MRVFARPCANHAFGDEDYEKVLTAWVDSHPCATVESLLGPLSQNMRGITSSSLVRVCPLLESFIESGCRQCILLPNRLEAAVISLVTKRPSLCKSTVSSRECFLITQHIVCHCKFLRAFARENEAPGKDRRYPKSGSIRRRLSATDWIVIRRVLSKVEIPKILGDRDEELCVSLEHPSSKGLKMALSTSSLASTIPFSDDGYPSFKDMAATLSSADEKPSAAIHGSLMEAIVAASSSSISASPKVTSSSSMMASPIAASRPSIASPLPDAKSVASVPGVLLDEDGWPIFPSMKTCSRRSPLADVEDEVAQPNYKLRKDAVLQARRSSMGPLADSKAAPAKKKPKLSSPPKMAGVVSKTTCCDQYNILETPLDKVSASSASDGRFEICGYVGGRRFHVCTLSRKAWGEGYVEFGNKIVDHCRMTGACKASALKYRDQLWSDRSGD